MKKNTSTGALPTTNLMTNENTNVLLETFTLHHESHLTRASFLCSTSTSALPKITLHCEANPLPRNTLNHEQKLAPFRLPYGTSTSALPKATLHCEGNLAHAIFRFIVKAIHHMRAHFLAHAQVHCKNQHYTMSEI